MFVPVRLGRTELVERFAAQEQQLAEGGDADAHVFRLLAAQPQQQMVLLQGDRFVDETTLRLAVYPQHIVRYLSLALRGKGNLDGAEIAHLGE